MNKNKNLLIWASDLSPNTGEGILARAFLVEMLKFRNCKKIKIKTLEQVIYLNTTNIEMIRYGNVANNSFFHKYIGPVYGALYLMVFSCKYQVAYLNYLPLWNFLIFFILPGKTILGPITGGVYSGPVNSCNLIIRKYLFPLFYKISKIIIYKKFKKAIFSTSILKPYMKKKNFLLYNFVTMLFNKQNHKTKKNMTLYFTIAIIRRSIH